MKITLHFQNQESNQDGMPFGGVGSLHFSPRNYQFADSQICDSESELDSLLKDQPKNVVSLHYVNEKGWYFHGSFDKNHPSISSYTKDIDYPVRNTFDVLELLRVVAFSTTTQPGNIDIIRGSNIINRLLTPFDCHYDLPVIKFEVCRNYNGQNADYRETVCDYLSAQHGIATTDLEKELHGERIPTYEVFTACSVGQFFSAYLRSLFDTTSPILNSLNTFKEVLETLQFFMSNKEYIESDDVAHLEQAEASVQCLLQMKDLIRNTIADGHIRLTSLEPIRKAAIKEQISHILKILPLPPKLQQSRDCLPAHVFASRKYDSNSALFNIPPEMVAQIVGYLNITENAQNATTGTTINPYDEVKKELEGLEPYQIQDIVRGISKDEVTARGSGFFDARCGESENPVEESDRSNQNDLSERQGFGKK